MSKYLDMLAFTLTFLLMGCSSAEPPAAEPTPTTASNGLAAVATPTPNVEEEPTPLLPTATPAAEPAAEPSPTLEPTAAVNTTPYQNPIDISQKKCQRLDSLTYNPVRQTLFGLNNEGLICELDPSSGEIIQRHSIDEDDPQALTADPQTGMLFVAAREDGDVWEIDPETFEIVYKYEIKFTINDVKIADKKDIKTEDITLAADPSGELRLYLMIEIDDPNGDYFMLVESSLPAEKVPEKMDLVLNNATPLNTKDFRGLLYNNQTTGFYTIDKETLTLVALSATGEQLQTWPVNMEKPDAFTQTADGTLYVAQKGGLFKYASTSTPPTQVVAQPVETAVEPEPEPAAAADFSYQLDTDFALKDCENLSGVVYHLERNTLFAINDNGTLCEIEPASDTVLHKDKITSDDLEGITYNPATGLLYIAIERDEAIIEVDPATFAILRKFELERAFNGQPVITTGGQGVEAITFVPDSAQPEGGTFFLTNQSFESDNPEDASAVIEVVLPLSQPPTTEQIVVPLLNYYPMDVLDLSGLYYDATADLLYIISDDSDALLEVTRTGEIVATYPLPGDGQEGITLAPDGSLYIAEDLAGLTFYRPLTQ